MFAGHRLGLLGFRDFGLSTAVRTDGGTLASLPSKFVVRNRWPRLRFRTSSPLIRARAGGNCPIYRKAALAPRPRSLTISLFRHHRFIGNFGDCMLIFGNFWCFYADFFGLFATFCLLFAGSKSSTPQYPSAKI
jgi:hypothetical protein